MLGFNREIGDKNWQEQLLLCKVNNVGVQDK